MTRRVAGFIALGLVVALALAFFVSPFASSQPDGLNKVAAEKGFDQGVKASPTGASPLAGYGVSGVDNHRLGKGLSGIIGVALTFAIGCGLLALVKVSRRRKAVVT